MPPGQPPASQLRVFLGVAAAMAFAAAPFAFKEVRKREEQARDVAVRMRVVPMAARVAAQAQVLTRVRVAPPCACALRAAAQVAAMRDASYAKDDARNARLQGPKRQQGGA
jgi:hypothetical protein